MIEVAVLVAARIIYQVLVLVSIRALLACLAKDVRKDISFGDFSAVVVVGIISPSSPSTNCIKWIIDINKFLKTFLSFATFIVTFDLGHTVSIVALD